MTARRTLALGAGVVLCWGLLAAQAPAAEGLVEKALEQAKQTGRPILAVAGRKS